MIDREHGKVAHKYLFDSHNGKVVRRTEDGDPNKWESGSKSQDGRLPRAHDAHVPKTHNEIAPKGHELTTTIDTESGARMSRDSHSRVCAIEDGYGAKRVYNRDASGRVNEISLTINGKVEQYKPGNDVAGVTQPFWFKQPHNPADKTPGVQISIDDATNSLKISTKANEFIVYGADGSISQKAGSEPIKETRPAYKSGLGAPDLDRPVA